MTTASPLGLLLDIDGPIASPVTRTIAIPSITRDIVTLANSGVPIAFNTGRSDAFVRDQIVTPLLAAGLAPDARVVGVCEKGAVWFGATMRLFDGVHIDRELAVPAEAQTRLRKLLTESVPTDSDSSAAGSPGSMYADFMYWDDPKHAMASLEQRTDVSSDAFTPVRDAYAARAFDLLDSMGLGVVLDERRTSREPTLRIEPTVISVDVEAIELGKGLGARRALELLGASGTLPRLWRTVGDSRSDYAMADQLHADGFEVAHVDVWPTDGIPEKPYRVIVEGDLVHDAAGAAFLAHWVRKLG